MTQSAAARAETPPDRMLNICTRTCGHRDRTCVRRVRSVERNPAQSTHKIRPCSDDHHESSQRPSRRRKDAVSRSQPPTASPIPKIIASHTPSNQRKGRHEASTQSSCSLTCIKHTDTLPSDGDLIRPVVLSAKLVPATVCHRQLSLFVRAPETQHGTYGMKP